MMSRPRRRILGSTRDLGRRTAPYAASLVFVLVSAGLAEVLFRLTGAQRLSMIFLASVLVSAVLFGSGPAYLAAAAAFAVYNFYLVDPRFTFSMDPEDAITLTVFLIVAMLTGNLAGRIRDEAARAKARATMASILFGATGEFSASSDEGFIRQRLAHHLAAATKGEALVLDGLRRFSAPEDFEATDALILEAGTIARSAAAAPTTAQRDDWAFRPLKAGDAQLGVAAWRPLDPSGSRPDERVLVELLVDAGAAALSRARLAAAKSEAETRARTEDLRNALLSSISHDMRTPLAAIMVSAGSLRRYGGSFDDATRADLSATIEEEAARLDAFVANLLNMTRLESGALAVQRIGFSVPEVVERIVARRSTTRRDVTVAALHDLPEGAGDPLLFEQVFGNVLENALRYSEEGQAVMVSTLLEDEKIVVEVADEGPGVPGPELARIFEKFFRSSGAANQAGTGLGLAIARGLVEAMGGSIDACNRNDAAKGLRVRISLPVMA
jgi:two-component system sensor histidine kinase KdpD